MPPPAKPPASAVVGAVAARIQVAPDAEVERGSAEGRADTAVDVDFSSGAVGERDALGRGTDVELQVLVDVVARLEIGGRPTACGWTG